MKHLKTKLWLGVGAFVLAGGQSHGPGDQASIPTFGLPTAWAAGGEGGEAGRKKPSAVEQKVNFLSKLALVEGHLLAGVKLYSLGDVEAAKTHMKHPGSELVKSMAADMKAYQVPSFATALQTLAGTVEQKKPVPEVNAALSKVRDQLNAARHKVNVPTKAQFAVLSNVVREAAEEYGEGVKNGAVVNAHEYQDAYGFVEAAKALANLLQTAPAHVDAVTQARSALAALDSAFPALPSAPRASVDTSVLYAAAAKIDLAASSLP